MTIENSGIENISSIAPEETEAERDARHIEEEGKHIREFMFLQKDFILRLMQRGNRGEVVGAVKAEDFDAYFTENWGTKKSDKFRNIFRGIRDEEENRHENLWVELKSEDFRETLLSRIEEEFAGDNGEQERLAA